MLAEAEIYEKIIVQAKKLPIEYRLRLIQQVSASLLPFPDTTTQPIQYGKYRTERMSTLEDFALAEWHPDEDETYGS